MVNFLFLLIFVFSLCQIHENILPYPKTKEKQNIIKQNNNVTVPKIDFYW